MITNNEAGIDCIHCGHQQIVKTEEGKKSLSEGLEWSNYGDPFCPECGEIVTFEDYLDAE